MSDILNGRPPMSFWLIGGAALIWNLFGVVIYVMQVGASPEDLTAAGYTPEQVAFMAATPKWATSAFAIAVTTGVVGCIFLLLQKAWAVMLFVISLLAVLVQNLHAFVLNDTIALFGTTPAFVQAAIVIVGVVLIWYSRLAKSKSWIA